MEKTTGHWIRIRNEELHVITINQIISTFDIRVQLILLFYSYISKYILSCGINIYILILIACITFKILDKRVFMLQLNTSDLQYPGDSGAKTDFTSCRQVNFKLNCY
jgi:hypothetical protein